MHHGRSRSKALDNINVAMIEGNSPEPTCGWSQEITEARMRGDIRDRSLVPSAIQMAPLPHVQFLWQTDTILRTKNCTCSHVTNLLHSKKSNVEIMAATA